MTHEVSNEVLKIFKSFPLERHQVLVTYREIQIELLRFHFPHMNEECKERAIDTAIRLDKNKYEHLI